DLLAGHLPLLQPDPVAESQRLLLGQLILEVVAEAAVGAFAVPGLARVARVVEVGDGVALVAELEAHSVPGQVDVLLVVRPVARLAGLALAVGAEEVGLLLVLDGDLVGGAELEAGMLWIAVERHRAAGRLEQSGPLDEGASLDVIDGDFTLLMGEDFLPGTVPVQENAMAAKAGAANSVDFFFVRNVIVLRKMPGIGLFFPVIETDIVEAKKQAAMVGVEHLRSLRQLIGVPAVGHNVLAIGPPQMMEHLVSLVSHL